MSLPKLSPYKKENMLFKVQEGDNAKCFEMDTNAITLWKYANSYLWVRIENYFYIDDQNGLVDGYGDLELD